MSFRQVLPNGLIVKLLHVGGKLLSGCGSRVMGVFPGLKTLTFA